MARGMLAKKKYRNTLEDIVNKRNIEFFSNQAIVIQRLYIGFYFKFK